MTETFRWRQCMGGFVFDAGTRRFFVDVGHSLPNLWFASERTYPGGELAAQETFQGPTAQDDARRWCEARIQRVGATTHG
jgi:hypothetical protein